MDGYPGVKEDTYNLDALDDFQREFFRITKVSDFSTAKKQRTG